MAAANGMALMIVGRVVMGLGVGAGTMIGPVYLAEMAPAKLRGSLNVIFQLFVSPLLVLGWMKEGGEVHLMISDSEGKGVEVKMGCLDGTQTASSR